MILTCPECATSYFVDDSRIPEAGRTVKCTSCAHRWFAKKETGEFTSADPEPPEGFEAQPDYAAHPGDAPPPEDDLEVVAPDRATEPEPEFPRSAARRAAAARAPARSAKGEAQSKVAVWAVAAALAVALVGGAIVFRAQVVRLLPASQAAYAGLGLPVNSVGLVIEEVRAEPTFLGGRPVLSVTGSLRNVKGQAVNSPALRVNLLGRGGKPLAAKIVRPIDPKVPAGGIRHFAIAITDPPANASDLEVVFETGQQQAGPPTPISAPAPVEAQPLPAGSPEALSEHG